MKDATKTNFPCNLLSICDSESTKGARPGKRLAKGLGGVETITWIKPVTVSGRGNTLNTDSLFDFPSGEKASSWKIFTIWLTDENSLWSFLHQNHEWRIKGSRISARFTGSDTWEGTRWIEGHEHRRKYKTYKYDDCWETKRWQNKWHSERK